MRGPRAATLAAVLLLVGIPAHVEGADAPPGPATMPAAVYRASGGTYRDFTAEAKSEGPGDVITTGTAGDALYIGHPTPFDQTRLNLDTPGEKGTVVWEYHGADGWKELDASDGTDNLRRTGPHVTSWTTPATWTAFEIDATHAPGKNFYVRARVTQTYATAATVSTVRIEAWSHPAGVQREAAQVFQARDPLRGGFRGVTSSGEIAIAVGDRGLILRSTDWGERWTKIASSTDEDLRDVAANGTSVVAVGADGGILRSTDAGLTWSSVASPTQKRLESVAWGAPSTLYAVGDGVILGSTDSGAHWGAPVVVDAHLEDVAMDDKFGMAVGTSGVKGVVYRLLPTNGATWTLIPLSGGAPAPLRGVAVRPGAPPRTIWAVGDQVALQSVNDGQLWTTFADAFQWKDVVLRGANDGWIVGDKAIEHLQDGEVPSFESVLTTDQFVCESVVFGRGDRLLVAGPDLLLHRDGTGNNSWWRSGWKPSTDLRAVRALGSGSVFAVGADGIFLRSPDSGANWSVMRPPLGGQPNAVEFVDENEGWVVGEQGYVMHTVNRGRSWSPADPQNSLSPSTKALGIAFSPKAPNGSRRGVIVADVGQIYYSKDGQSWLIATVGQTTTATLRSVDYVTAETFVAVGSGDQVFRSTNGGETWTGTSAIGDHYSVRFADASHGWIAGSQGHVLSSSDGGSTWQLGAPAEAGTLNVVDGTSADNVWTAGPSGRVLRSNDGGKDWSSVATNGDPLYGIAGFPSTPSVAVGKAGLLLRSGRSWANATSQVATGTSVVLDASHAAGDALYIGQPAPFDSVVVDVAAPGASGASVRWEAWTGSAWQAVAAVDSSNSFNRSGLGVVQYPLPASWTTTKVGEDGAARYWLRARFTVPPLGANARINGLGTLRLTVPVTGGPTPTGPDPEPVPGFSMGADPAELHLGPVARGATANRTATVVGVLGSASASVTVDGPAAEWFHVSSSAFELTPASRHSLTVDVRIPADAPPGRAEARLVVLAHPQGSSAIVRGWIALDVIVAAADLTEVTYEATTSTWKATFVNELSHGVHAKFEATVQPVDGVPRALPPSEADVAPGGSTGATGDLAAAGLAPGPYDLAVSASFDGTVRARSFRIFLGGPPVSVDNLVVEVKGTQLVTFRFAVTNTAGVPLEAHPALHVRDLDGTDVDVIEGTALPLQAGESVDVQLTWDPQFGLYTAQATASVDHAVTATKESAFTVQGKAPAGGLGASALLWFGVAGVAIVGGLVAVGVLTGRRRRPPV